MSGSKHQVTKGASHHTAPQTCQHSYLTGYPSVNWPLTLGIIFTLAATRTGCPTAITWDWQRLPARWVAFLTRV